MLRQNPNSPRVQKAADFIVFFSFKLIFLRNYRLNLFYQGFNKKFRVPRRILGENGNQFGSCLGIFMARKFAEIFLITTRLVFQIRVSANMLTFFLFLNSQANTLYFCWNNQTKINFFHPRSRVSMDLNFQKLMFFLQCLDNQVHISSLHQLHFSIKVSIDSYLL